MLYILAGASRTGKSTIARRCVTQKQIPFFCIDFLTNSLQHIPSLGIHHDLPFIEKAEKLWPYAEPLLAGLVCDEPQYLIEGDGLLPKDIYALQERFGDDIRACFVGYAHIAPQEKFDQIRAFATHQDDWTHKFSDEALLDKMQGMVDFSAYLEAECGKYSLTYFDCSQDFDGYLERVFEYLTK